MRFVMVGEHEPAAILVSQSLPQLTRQVQFLFQPERQRLAKRAVAARRECEVRLEQALEFRDRLIVEANVVEVGGG